MTQTRPLTRRRLAIESSVRRYMDEQSLWPQDGRLLLAVSGGPDSTALLLVMSKLAAHRQLYVAAAHFDHALRGPEAGETEACFVRELAESTGVPFFGGSGDVRGRARREHTSIEDAARRERYEFLARVARENGYSAVATGHTASDQAETVLMHLLRGSGLNGLAGMAPRAAWPLRGHDGIELLRPLLSLSRDQTVEYCDLAGVQPLQDPSNASPEYRRNRVRNELLPLLRDYNPSVDDALVRLAEAARGDVDYLEQVASAAVEVRPDGDVVLSRQQLVSWPRSLRRRGLQQALRSLAGDLQGFSERHLRALERLLLQGRTGDSLDLARGVEARLSREALELSLRPDEVVSLLIEAVGLTVPGEACFGCLVVAVGSNIEMPDGVSVELDAEALGTQICVRQRRPGDRFQPLGMQQSKKLQDFFVDAHVERRQRDAIPIFESARGIAWVGGLRIAEWAKPRPGLPTVTLAYRPAAQ